LFYTFLNVPLGYTVARISELALGAALMYLYLVSVGAKPSGALIGGLVFAFSAHSLLHLTGLGWWGGLLWMPLILLFADRAMARKSYRAAIMAGVFLAAQFYCGFMPNQIYYVGLTVLYYLFFALTRAGGLGGAARLEKKVILNPMLARAVAFASVTLVVGLVLAATQWVPIMELLKYSNRRIVPTESGFIYLPLWYLATLAFPNLFGTAYDARMVNLFTALGVSHDHSLYVGIAGLVPAAFCFFALRRAARNRRLGLTGGAIINARAPFFAMLVILSILIVVAAPLYVHATKFIPVLQTIRVIVRATVLYIVGTSALAAFGTDLLMGGDSDAIARFSRWMRRALIALVLFVILATAASYYLNASGFLKATDYEYIPGSGYLAYARIVARALSQQFMPPDAGLLAPLAALALVSLLIRLLKDAKLSRGVFFAVLVSVLLADLFWNSRQYEKLHDSSQVFPATRITDTLASLPQGRVLVAPSDIKTNRRASDLAGDRKIVAPPNTLLPYKVAGVTGKDQLYPKTYRDFCALIEPQPHLSHVVFDETSSPFFDLLNVRYILTRDSEPPPAHSELLLTAEGLSLYENKLALPRAFFATQVIGVRGEGEMLKIMERPGFDPLSTVVVQESGEPEGGPSRSQTGASGPGEATVIEARRNRVVVETASEHGGLLVLSDNYYPGWEAFIDGKSVELLRANHTMRAVRVPPGSRVVSFDFVPEVFRASAYVSLAGAFAVLAALVIPASRKKRGASR
ncbi:MAG TPA: YfhO family protein, partial [Blastocatellia bacterium]|nr:YfhO family protein [Blastocatellia bacterium]